MQWAIMKDKRKWTDLVKEYFPEADREECDFILWECTAFPMADIDTVKNQLKELKKNGK